MTETIILAVAPLCPDDGRSVGRSAEETVAPVPHPLVSALDAVPPPERAAADTLVSWRFELFLAFCSGWVAIQLWFWPDQIPMGTSPEALSSSLRGHEPTWALITALAALLKVSGLVCRVWTPWILASSVLMLSGLFMSVVIWTIVGITWAFDFPHSVAPIILIGGGLGAAWQLSLWRLPPVTWK